MNISIVVTLKNEEQTIKSLLDSLLQQEPPFEIIIVDSQSTDQTQHIINNYRKHHDNIHLHVKKSSRGGGRNYGVSKAQADYVAFTDGGCQAAPDWLKNIRKQHQNNYDIVSGKTIDVGKVTDIKRVEVIINNTDVTWPSCNLSYNKKLFQKIQGFDETFITAEDIDLNFRAIQKGAKLIYEPKAIIHRNSAQNALKYLKQSYWYGYGRKQLVNKHGKLWSNYNSQSMITQQLTPYGIIRLLMGLLGYLKAKFSIK